MMYGGGGGSDVDAGDVTEGKMTDDPDSEDALSMTDELAATSLESTPALKASRVDTITAADGTSVVKDKWCLVCGDRALGHNFNAVSCESCKAFFRRNAFKEIRGRCNGTCEVTVESRSYCKRCRLQKCFAVGMRRELILSEQQKQLRCQKIRDNRMRRSTGGSSVSGSSVTSGASVDSFESAGGSGPSVSADETKPAELTHVIASAVDPDMLHGLSQWCTEQLDEVMHAFKVSFDHAMERQPVTTPSNEQFLNMADTSVKRLVKMAKHLTVFRSLEQTDQISLLKGAVVEVLVLRSSKMFNSQSMSWQVKKGGQDHQVSAASLNLTSPQSMHFIQQYQMFVKSLLQSTRRDNILLMLLIVMAVFAPDRVRSSSIPTVAKIQEQYAAVLREYIQRRYPSERLMLARLLQRLCDIRDLNEKHMSMLLNMKLDELEPLIVEIFDL